MKAMILAAGFGTRLRPLTEKIPKALIPVANLPLMERNIALLKSWGIKDIIINAHYLSEAISNFASKLNDPDLNITVKTENEILGTGGGIANCADFLKDDTFVVFNGDILTDINIVTALKEHKENGSTATMILHDRAPFNQIVIDKNHKILKIHRSRGSERLAFTGIQILEPEILNHIPNSRYSDIIKECYNPLVEAGENIMAHVVTGHYWFDLGTTDSYVEANRFLLKSTGKKFLTGTGTRIPSDVSLKGWAVIGDNVRIGKGAVIERSILWDNIQIGDKAVIKNCIITSSCEDNEVLSDKTVI